MTGTETTTAAEPTISDLRSLVTASAGEPEAPAETATAETKTAPATEPETAQETGSKRGADGKFAKAAETQPEADEAVPAGVQKRIDKAVKAQREAERKAAELEQRLAQTQGTPPAQKAAAPATAETGKPDPTKFDSYEAYNEAIVDWKLEQKELAKAQAERDRANQAAAKARGDVWNERTAQAKADHADFDEVMTEAAQMPISEVMHMYIVESEIGPKLAYHLATNPDQAAAIHKMGPVAAARELVKLEASLMPAAAADAKTTTPAKPTAKPLPKPPAAIGGSHAPSAVDLSDPKIPLSTWKKTFQKQLARS